MARAFWKVKLVRNTLMCVTRMTRQEFHTYFVVSPPDHPALSPERESSDEMQREVLGEIINVTDCQARTDLAHVDQRAPFKNAGHFLAPSGLVDRSTKKQTPIEKMRVHWR
jgi:hypothetical protein